MSDYIYERSISPSKEQEAYLLFREFSQPLIEKRSEEVVEQLLKFPSVTHDEYVDTTSQYLLDYQYKHEGSKIGTNSVYKTLSKVIRGI